MSFSSEAKAELCRAPTGGRNSALAECCGVLLYCNTFSNDLVKVVTHSREFADRLPKLFLKAFGFGFDETLDISGGTVLKVMDPGKLGKILEVYGYENSRSLARHINFGIFEDDDCRRSFIRGAFLAGGSVTDPGKRYHLELVTAHYNVRGETVSVLLDMGFEPGSVFRGGSYVIYFKHSETIEDFLTTIGAPVAAMGMMSLQIEKGMNNSVNRRVNCELANVSKIVDASQEQLSAIRRLRAVPGVFGTLPAKLAETAVLREENPELSLGQLAELFHPPVSKSCLNHRLRKLAELADELK